MALVPATVAVSFVANYAGVHRVCYRLNGAGAYTCITGSCVGGGATCTINIPITVDNETCVAVPIDGYVQAICQDILSTTGRVLFNVTFTPTPSCAKYTVTCVSAGVVGITVTAGGSGYNPAAPPSVTITGGGGSGATAVAVIGAGIVTTTNLIAATSGSGYANQTSNNVRMTSSSGTGALATIVVAGGVFVSGTITARGTGYPAGATLTPNATDMASAPITPMTFNVVTDSGTITAVTVTAKGSGYTSIPTIGFGSGLGAASAVLDFCSPLAAPQCGGGSSGITLTNVLTPGQTVALCNTGAVPAIPADYTIVQNGNCLCAAQVTTFTATGTIGSIVTYSYNARNGTMLRGTLIVGGSPSNVTVCAVTGSALAAGVNGAVGTITYNGTC